MSFIDVFKKALITIDDYVWLSKLLDVLYCRDALGKLSEYEKELFVRLGKKASTPSGVDYRACIEASFYFECLAGLSQFDGKGNYQGGEDRYCEDWRQFVCSLMNTTGYFDSHFNDLLMDKGIYGKAWKELTERIIAERGDIGTVLSSIYDSKATLKEIMQCFVHHTEGQFKEECLKAFLIEEDGAWKEKITAANRLPYFDGQVYFLFEAAKKGDGVPGYDMDVFDKFTQAASALHDKTNSGILRDKLRDNAMRQILLSFGDYRVRYSNSHYSAQTICTSYEGDGPKYVSWRNFFDVLSCEIGDEDEASKRMAFIKRLLVSIVQNDYNADAAVEMARNAVWRRYDWMSTLVLYPEVFERLNNCAIVYTDDGWSYLITQRSKATKQVQDKTLDWYAININIYRIYMELGFGCCKDFWQGEKDRWQSGKKEIKQTAWNRFCVKDGALKRKEGTVEEVIRNV